MTNVTLIHVFTFIVGVALTIELAIRNQKGDE
jgi:hypothetical protein